jgi:hypothetical protein
MVRRQTLKACLHCSGLREAKVVQAFAWKPHPKASGWPEADQKKCLWERRDLSIHPSTDIPVWLPATLRAVLPQLWPSASLQPGAKLNSSDTIDKVNLLQITAQSPSLVGC